MSHNHAFWAIALQSLAGSPRGFSRNWAKFGLIKISAPFCHLTSWAVRKLQRQKIPSWHLWQPNPIITFYPFYLPQILSVPWLASFSIKSIKGRYFHLLVASGKSRENNYSWHPRVWWTFQKSTVPYSQQSWNSSGLPWCAANKKPL